MTNTEFRAVLDWFMCSDPWPVERDVTIGESNHVCVTNWLDREAKARGFDDWVVAFHEFKV